MAKKQARPGRTLIIFFLGVAVAYGLVALNGVWKPELGLDLQGGTRITLTAQGNPSGENLDEARAIIDNRVNGSGVAEAEVATQGGGNIVVEIPGNRRRDLIDTVERQAQLRFRLVLCPTSLAPECLPGTATAPVDPNNPMIPGTTVVPTPGATNPSGNPSNNPSGNPSNNPSGNPSGNASNNPTPNGATSAPGANRVAPFSEDTTTPTPTPSPAPASPAATTTPGGNATTPSGTATPSQEPTTQAPVVDNNAIVPLDEALAYQPTEADVLAYNAYDCAPDGSISKVPGSGAQFPPRPVDDPSTALVGCLAESSDIPPTKYLLSPAVINGTDLDDANYGIPQGQTQFAVDLQIGGTGRDVFAALSSQWTGTQNQFAIVLDGEVISAPTFTGPIPNGQAQITGTFTEVEAQSLATSLRFGALPISFDEPTVETIGPSLAGDQLSAGLVAGGFGLGLVLIYCLFYYRGLGVVVVASLLAAAVVTYALVLLLSETAGFTLTLPGIAGLIIAVGVTADSFIIFFERIRDEMREGKSMRVAVETGWKRAKKTRVAAQVVSLLSALVLYIFATGAVKGFGFALGLTTLVDLAILFWFTKPMVSWLARFTFYNSGHRLSGLSAGTLGMDAPLEGGKA